MPDVGVLNLTIKDNSEQAAQGLTQLAGALSAVKQAVNGGLKLSGVASQVKKLADEIKKINAATFIKLRSLKTSLEGFKDLGNIRISIKDDGSTKRIRESIEASRNGVNGISEGFEKVSGGISNANKEFEAFHSKLSESASLIQHTNWTAGADQFAEMFDQWSRMRSMFSLGPGEKEGLSINPEETGWAEWKNGAIEVEGSVSAAADSVARLGDNLPAIWQAGDSFERLGANAQTAAEDEESAFSKILEANMEAAAEADKIRKQQEENFYASSEKPIYDMGQTNAMAESLSKLDLLKAQLGDAQAKYNEFVNTLGAGATKTIKAGLAVKDLEDKIREFQQELNDNSAKRFGMTVDEMRQKIEEMHAAKQTISAPIGDSLAQSASNTSAALDQVRTESESVSGVIESAGDAADGAAGNMLNLHSALATLKNGLKTIGSPISKLLAQFKRIAKYRMLRYVLKAITSGFKEGVENVYKYSSAIGSSFAPAMDNASSAMAQMKNSIGAAAMPAIQSLIPVLQTVVSWVIAAVNALNQLFALLRGQATWTRATNRTVKAFDDQKKAAQGAGGAIKDLLADWDELNIIQSEAGGGGGGGGAEAAEEFLGMFEEVNKFDKRIRDIVGFIQDHMNTVLNVAKDIGLAILAWKLSNTFLKDLSALSTLIKLGVLVKLAIDTTTLFDEAYVESDNALFLVADGLMAGALAAVAGKLAEAKFGEGAGLITAGVILAVSAGASFAVAEIEARTEAQKNMLQLLAGVKAGIAYALIASGLIGAGVSALLALVGGAIAVGLITHFTYTMTMDAIAAQTAKEVALKAFAKTGEGGIDVAEYEAALYEEFEKHTSGVKLVLDAYIEVPSLKSKLYKTAAQITAFNQIIFKGAGKLTAEDATSFKENWGTIIETLKQLNADDYSTILAGLTEALNSKSAELRKSAEEIRMTFIMLEKNIAAEDMEIYQAMEQITSKIATGEFTDNDLKEYEKYYRILASATETGFDEINKALEKGTKIDFGDEDSALERAKEFISNVGEAADRAYSDVDAYLADITDSVERKKRKETAKQEAGLITAEELKERIDNYDAIIATAEEYAKEKRADIEDSLNKAYEVLFGQALKTDAAGTWSYWENVLIPLMEQANEAGAEIPESVSQAFAKGISEGWLDFGFSPDTFLPMVEGMSPELIATYFNDAVNEAFGRQTAISRDSFGALFAGQFGMTDIQVAAANLLGTNGWDMLYEEIQAYWVESFKNAFGEETTRQILSNLGVDADTIAKMLPYAEGVQQVVEETTQHAVDNATEITTPVEEMTAAIEDLSGTTLDEPIANADKIAGPIKDATKAVKEFRETVTEPIPEEDVDIWDLEGIKDAAGAAEESADIINRSRTDLMKAYMEEFDTGGMADYFEQLEESASRAAGSAQQEIANTVNEIDKTVGGKQEPLKLTLPVDLDLVGEDELSDEAITYIKSVKAAMELGLSKDQVLETQAAGLQVFGVDAFLEAQPYLQELFSQYNEWLESNAEISASMDVTASTVTEDVDVMSSQIIGAIDNSAFISSLNNTLVSTIYYVNATLAQLSRLNGINASSGSPFASPRSGGGGVKNIVAQLRAGGGPIKSGDLIMANENGRIEMMGTMGTQPIVANNQQIIEGISQGVASAQNEQNSLLRRQNDLLMQILNKKMEAVVKPTSSLGRANSRSAAMYDRVTG